MATTINADTSTGGVVLTGDGSGVLELQAAGVTKATLNSSGMTLATPLPVASGGTGAASLSGITTGTATNLAGGSNGTIPYQSASGTTQMLAVGTSGQLLQSNGAAAPTWVAASSGALTLLSTVTASNSATVDVETTFDSTYDVYVIVANNVLPATDAAVLHSLLKVNGTYQTSNYEYLAARIQPTTANVFGSTVSTSDTKIIVGDAAAGTTNLALGGNYFTMQVYNPAGTTNRKIINWDGSNIRPDGNSHNLIRLIGNGVYTGGTQALTGVRFEMSTGNIASGSFRLYGIRKT